MMIWVGVSEVYCELNVLKKIRESIYFSVISTLELQNLPTFLKIFRSEQNSGTAPDYNYKTNNNETNYVSTHVRFY